jgi:hypothetical protein
LLYLLIKEKKKGKKEKKKGKGKKERKRKKRKEKEKKKEKKKKAKTVKIGTRPTSRPEITRTKNPGTMKKETKETKAEARRMKAEITAVAEAAAALLTIGVFFDDVEGFVEQCAIQDRKLIHVMSSGFALSIDLDAAQERNVVINCRLSP